MSSPPAETANNSTPQSEAIVSADRAEPISPQPTAVNDGEWLRSMSRWTPVTWVLVAANVAWFIAMALRQQMLVEFSPYILLNWGGGLAPRVFDSEWWRAGSYMFTHADLAHLATNLLFLLLIARLMECLLGSMEFALVYAFAGLGGGLLLMGASPQHVVVGSSAAIYGTYGALLGCCVRGPRSIPWRIVAHRGGWLLLYLAVSLLAQWVDFVQQPIGHLGGFVFGFVGGLLCGHRLQPRAAPWRRYRLPVAAIIGAVLIGLTAREVHRWAAKALTFYEKYATAKDRERELVGRFNDALHQWEQGKLSSADWKKLLADTLIPAWQDTRVAYGLKLRGKRFDLEQHRFSMHDFWRQLRLLRGLPKADGKKPLTIEEYGDMVSLLNKLRLDTWRDLAEGLPGNHVMTVRALLDHHELDVLYAALDDEVNEGNPLRQWLDKARGHWRRANDQPAEPHPTLIKNPGFEAGLDGWKPFTWPPGSPPPRLDFDTQVVREGRQSLRIDAARQTDCGCYQEVTLKPNHYYRFSGWVRTRGLVSRGASVLGTFHIHARATNDFICKGTNHGGDTDWTMVSFTFKTRPNDGLIRIVLFLAGFGQGTGTVWFDDLKLEEVNPPA